MRPPLAAMALTAAVSLCAREASAIVRVQLAVEPPRPVAGLPFRVVYGLQIQNDRPARATPLEASPGLQVLMNGGTPTIGNFMVFGGSGGSVQMQSSVEYVFVAPRPGRYTVRGARALASDSNRVVAEHPPLTIVVEANHGQTPSPGPQRPDPFGGSPFPPGIFDDPIAPPVPPPAPVYEGPDVPPEGPLTGATFNRQGFARAMLSAPTAVVGEAVEYRAWVYVPAVEAGCEPLQEPTVTGFWSESLITPRQACADRWIPQTFEGQGLTAGLVRRLALYPTRAGALTVGPLRMNVEYLVGDSFFGRRQMVPMASGPVSLTVEDAPLEGRPRGYVPGVVGPVGITAALDRDRVVAGETVTLTLRLEASAYIGSVTAPPPALPDGVRRLPGPSHSEVDTGIFPPRGIATHTWRLVAERPGAIALGTYALDTFNPSTRRYERITAALPTLTVTGEAVSHPPDGDDEDPALRLEAFNPNARLDRHSALFTTPFRAAATLAAPPLALALWQLSKLLKRRAAARKSARDEASRNDPEALLAQSLARLEDNDPRAALDLAGRALDRGRKSVDTESTMIAEVQRSLDAVRFAGADTPSNEVRALIEQVRAALAEAGAL